MKSILTSNNAIHFNSRGYDELNALIEKSNFSKIFILVDENTHEYCLPLFLQLVETSIVIDIIEIEAGEAQKNIETCLGVWDAISNLNGDRKTLLINLGGGVITDLGGFVASTYRRGISFVNVPTSLLAMVDASIGGKTGVDLGVLKNQVGVFNSGEMVLIDTSFLNSLPEDQLRSGMAEMLKHGLIADEGYFDQLKNWEALSPKEIEHLIYESVLIKHKVVMNDPKEQGLRKSLNFGHTLGHAIESYFLDHPNKEPLLHGEAIAIGMIMAVYLSNKQSGLSKDKMNNIKSTIVELFGKVDLSEDDQLPIIELLKFDKKNTHGQINFVLLADIGKPIIDSTVDNQHIIEAFTFYSS
jgi:3-dehydroquinate synthase